MQLAINALSPFQKPTTKKKIIKINMFIEFFLEFCNFDIYIYIFFFGFLLYY